MRLQTEQFTSMNTDKLHRPFRVRNVRRSSKTVSPKGDILKLGRMLPLIGPRRSSRRMESFWRKSQTCSIRRTNRPAITARLRESMADPQVYMICSVARQRIRRRQRLVGLLPANPSIQLSRAHASGLALHDRVLSTNHRDLRATPTAWPLQPELRLVTVILEMTRELAQWRNV